MKLEANSRIQRHPNIVFSEIDGETVMMDSRFEKYFGMQAIGTRIWQLLEEETNLEAVCTQLTAEFDVDMQRCMEDAQPFVEELFEQDMVQLK